MSTALVLLNPQAATAVREGLGVLALLEVLRGAGLPAEVREVAGGEVAVAARQDVEAGAPVVVAAGGDGTVGAVAGAAALGVLPLGGFNRFAADLGIPGDPADAARTIAAGFRRRLDLVEVGDLPMVNNASRHPRVEQWSGHALTVEADVPRVDVFTDGEVHRLATPLRFRARPGELTVVVPAGREERACG